MFPEPGLVVGGRYVLKALLDHGGMGAVWSADDRVDARSVAIKFLTSSWLADRSALRRFRREARALERLDHPNVVKIVGHGLEENAPFIAMELLEGEPLKELLRRGALLPQQALEIIRQAAAGLIAAHALAIVHRDVKPSNLFLCASERDRITVKVIDFGIATGEVLEGDSQASGTGMIGSPAYMCPEQARGRPVDTQADVWSLAVVAFQMLTGREPFAGADVPETLQRICSGVAPVPSAVAVGLPTGVDEVFACAFAPSPAARYADVNQLVAALDRAYQGAPERAASSRTPIRQTGRTTATASFHPSEAVPRSAPLSSARARRWQAALVVGAGLSVVAAFRSVSQAPASASAVKSRLAPTVPSAPASNTSARLTVVPSSSAADSPSVARASVVSQTRSAAVRVQRAVVRAAPSASPSEPAPKSIELDPIFGLPLDGSSGRERSIAAESPRDARDAVVVREPSR